MLGEIVEGAQEDDIAVVRLMFDSGSMFVSNRDMCFLRYVKHEDNGTIYILAKLRCFCFYLFIILSFLQPE